MTLSDILSRLNQGVQAVDQRMQGIEPALERGFQSPAFHLGLGMMQGSQQGDPWGGAMQGMQNFGQFQRQALLSQKMREDKEAQEQAIAMRKAQSEAIRNNPQLMERVRQHSPLLAATIEAGGTPDVSEFKDPLGTKPTTPHQAAMEEMWGVKARTAERQADLAEAKHRQDYEQFLVEHGLRRDQFGFDVYRQQVMQQQQAADKERDARLAHVDLGSNLGKIDEMTGLINSLVSDESFDKLYSAPGQVADVVAEFPMLGRMASKGIDVLTAAGGSGVPDLRNMRNQIVDKVVFQVINDLQQASKTGSTGLGPMAVPEFEALQRSGTRLKEAKTADAARQAAKELVDQASRLRNNMIQRASIQTPAGMSPPTVPPAPGAAPSGGAPAGAPAGAQGGGKVLTADEINQIAKNRGVTPDEVRKRAQQAGYTFQ